MPWCLLLHAGEPGIRPGSVDVSDRCYELMRYVRSPPSGLKDSTSYPAFFMAPAMKPRTVCFSQPIFSMISASVAPFLRWSMATTWAVLLPSRGALAPVASSLAVVSLVALAFFGAPLAAVGAALAFLGLAAGAGSAAASFSTSSPSRSAAFQILAMADLRSVNRLTSFRSPKGGAPAKLFQTSTRRPAADSRGGA